MKHHPFTGETVFFGTKHKKDQLIRPLFNEIGMSCSSVEADTDQFGTFSGEVERTGSVRETLRGKIRATLELTPKGRFLLASEGSFVPHPLIGLIQIDLESLLLWDSEQNIEIYSEYLCVSPVHGEYVLGPRDDFRSALKNLGFPHHGVLVHPEGTLSPIFKGLQNEREVAQAMLDSFVNSTTARVCVKSDLRASHNLTRQKAIIEAGKNLLKKIKSFCPECTYPGFAIDHDLPGLQCSECGKPSKISKSVVWKCVKCIFEKVESRPDGKVSIDPGECEFCNP